MFYNRKAVRNYLNDKSGVSVSSDFWVALDVSIRNILDTAIRRNRNFKRITSAELGFDSKNLKRTEGEEDLE